MVAGRRFRLTSAEVDEICVRWRSGQAVRVLSREMRVNPCANSERQLGVARWNRLARCGSPEWQNGIPTGGRIDQRPLRSGDLGGACFGVRRQARAR